MRNKILFSLFLGLLFVNFVSAEMLTSEANVSYDSAILEQLKNSTEVDVFFELNNFSDIDNLFSILSIDDKNFKNIDKSPYRPEIDAKITQEGFDKLLNDSRIKVIYFNAPVHAIDNPSCGDGVCNNIENCTSCIADCGKCKKIISPIKNSWFWIIISVIILLVIIGLYFIKKQK